mgnify:CR=1 FL=1
MIEQSLDELGVECSARAVLKRILKGAAHLQTSVGAR